MRCTAASILPTPPAPQLPDFRTLLIQGDYPVSSPFHLCLSHLSNTDNSQHSRPRVLLVTAQSRSQLMTQLVEFNDDWLATNSGLGATAGLLSELRIYYPGTPDYWIFLFSIFQSGVPSDLEALSPNLNLNFDPPVSLVVLHEPSSYFLDHDSPGSFTMSSYLRLITSALASLTSLDPGTGPPRLAVFDSRLQHLALPCLPAGAEDGTGHGSTQKHDKVSLAVERYFEWIGTVETPPPLPSAGSSGRHLASKTYRMLLSPSQHLHKDPIIWEWRQTQNGDEGEHRNARRTVFHWE